MIIGGNIFHRVQTNLITPASTEIEVTASSVNIEIAPGENKTLEFIVRNFGPRTRIDVEFSDNQNFLTTSKTE